MYTSSKISPHATEKNYIAQFNRSLYWNLLDSVGTQALLIGHHIAVRTIIGKEFHGLFSTYLSLFYLAIILANAGFDTSLAPFFSYFTHSKNHFNALISKHVLPQLMLILSFCLLFIVGYYSSKTVFDFVALGDIHSQNRVNFPSALLSILVLTFITESIKKTCKYFLQLLFYNATIAQVEFYGMAAYMAAIWGSYELGYPVTIFSCFLFLCIISCIQLTILLATLIYYYTTLPSSETFVEPIESFWQRIQKNRVFIFGNQLASQFFSGNTLVPLCAYTMSFDEASFVKVITGISGWIILIAQKIFGISTIALLAKTKENSEALRQHMFRYSNAITQQALYILIIFLIINGKKLIQLNSMTTHITFFSWPIVYFLICMSFIESFFVVYEKWFIIEEKTYIFFFANASCLVLLYLGAQYSNYGVSSFSLPLLLGLFIIVRLSVFLALSAISFYLWNIKPTIELNLKSLIAGLILSLIFYVAV